MFKIILGNRLETLADELADLLGRSDNAPLVPEIVAVPNRGMARWLAFRFADRLGLCASVDFLTPMEVVFECFHRLGMDVPESLPGPEVTVWAISSILRERQDSPAFGPVAAYVRPGKANDSGEGLRRYELSRRLAMVFDQYPVYRPDWVSQWESGKGGLEDRDLAGLDETSRKDLLADERWQAEVWRDLRRRLPTTSRHFGKLAAELRELSRGGIPLERCKSLPPRISVFGSSLLAPTVVEALRNLGNWIDVNVFLLNPSRQYWGDIRNRLAISRDRSGLPPEEGHPLLASLGTHVRDFHRGLVEDPSEERFEDPRGDSVLHRLQADILDLCPPASPRLLDDADDSIRLHVCHGPMREVEVLHDQLLAMFEKDPKLRPRDVVVLAPNIEDYAPAIQAVFAERRTPSGAATSTSNKGEPPHLPFTIADRTMTAEQPIVSTFFDLLEIPGSRFDASAILDLLECTALRRQIGLDDGSVDVAQQWIRDARVRWGADERTAREFGLPERHENTWRFGFDRLFLGYAMSGDETWAASEEDPPVLPWDGVEGTEAPILGSISSLVARLARMDEDFRTPAKAAEWSRRLSNLHHDLFLPTKEDEAADVQLRRAIRAIGANATSAGHEDPIGLDVVRSELEKLLSGPGRAGQYLAGSITFASLQPMRSVPFRVVCMLGLNADAFPRIERPQGFDLVSRVKRRTGDQSRRDDDRHLFLEALLAARDRLYLSHVGLDQRENTEIPPSVVVSELLDAIRAGWFTEEAPGGETPEADRERREAVLGRIRIPHPLQPFSRKYFETGAEASPIFSYSRSMCAARVAAESDRGDAAGDGPPLVTVMLPPPSSNAAGTAPIDIGEFVRFFLHPTKQFLRKRLEIQLDESRDPSRDLEPLALDNLEDFGLRQAIFRGLNEEKSEQALKDRLRAEGLLPPGTMGRVQLDSMWSEASILRAKVAEHFGGLTPRDREQIDGLRVGDRSFTGVLEYCKQGKSVVDVRPASVRAKHELSLWIRHLIARCHGRTGPAVYIGVGQGEAEVFEIAEVGIEAAQDRLHRLIDLFDLGQRIPLRFFVSTSRATAKTGKGDAQWFENPFAHSEEESLDPWIKYAFRETDPRKRTDIAGEPTFDQLAKEIWGPCLEVLSR